MASIPAPAGMTSYAPMAQNRLRNQGRLQHDQWQGYRKSIGKRRWFIGNQTEARAVNSRTSKHHPICTTIIIAVLYALLLWTG